MKDRIESKMEKHIESILEKPIITDQEYSILYGYLMRIEAKTAEKKREMDMRESNERMKEQFSKLLGGM